VVFALLHVNPSIFDSRPCMPRLQKKNGHACRHRIPGEGGNNQSLEMCYVEFISMNSKKKIPPQPSTIDRILLELIRTTTTVSRASQVQAMPNTNSSSTSASARDPITSALVAPCWNGMARWHPVLLVLKSQRGHVSPAGTSPCTTWLGIFGPQPPSCATCEPADPKRPAL
jgi:hypothetical protein